MAHFSKPDGTPVSHNDPNYGDWYDWALEIEEARWRRANYTGPVYEPEISTYKWEDYGDEHHVKPRLDDEYYYWVDTAAHGGSGSSSPSGDQRTMGIQRWTEEEGIVYKDPSMRSTNIDPYGGHDFPAIRPLPGPEDAHWDYKDEGAYQETKEFWAGREVWKETRPSMLWPEHPDADDRGYVPGEGHWLTIPSGSFSDDLAYTNVKPEDAVYQSNIVNLIQRPPTVGEEPIAWSQDGVHEPFDPDKGHYTIWDEYNPDVRDEDFGSDYTPTSSTSSTGSDLYPGGYNVPRNDYGPVTGGYDGFNFGDPKDTSGVTGNDPTGRPITGNEGIPPSTGAITPFPTPPKRGVGSVGISPSAHSLGRNNTTGINPLPTLPNFTNNNPMKIYNNKVRRTGDLARTSGRFLRTLTL